ncbi:hypothetical protein, partial [Bacillus subtilis]|uniref:hypothetical protein n=1 Tax=Bacillus subtilis TaxID=1423 RepID=UPI003C295389
YHDCCIVFRLRSIRLLMHFLPLQKRKNPTALTAGFECLFLIVLPPFKVKAAYQSRIKYDLFN